MASLEELRRERIRKLELLKEKGIDPYPATSSRERTIGELLEQFETLDTLSKVTIAGRILAIRKHGGAAFIDLYDGTGKIQGYLKEDVVGKDSFTLFDETIDIGDFIDFSGIPLLTKRGEKSILASDWRILTKSLLPLPEKWHGLQDTDERFRKRYLDILFNPELQELFQQKARFWKAARDFLVEEGFIEVHTPTLEFTTGGAEATPFKTHHNDFDIDVYLRISVGELWQKRLMAAGFPRTFEIGRTYRNEGSSPEHLQEFTNIEFYAAYMDFEEGLALLERHINYVLDHAFDGKRHFSIRGFDVNFEGEWKHIDYVDTVEQETGINVLEASEADMRAKLEALGVTYEGANRERLTDTLWKYCRKQIAGPVWLTGHPKLVSPLSKVDPEDSRKTQRAQLIIAGSELNNCFAELNDPLDQRQRFEVQQQLITEGDNEAMMPEWEFVEMLEHGMPPTFGASTVGERFFAFLVDKPIRETQLFPLMKPKEGEQGKKKSKETKVAVAVVNTGAGLEPWQELNTVAHLTAAFGARQGKDLLRMDTIETKDNEKIKLNIGHAIMLKQADSVGALQELVKSATEEGLDVAEFTREMLETTNDNKVAQNTAEKNFNEVEHLGVLVFGERSKVEALTEKFALYS